MKTIEEILRAAKRDFQNRLRIENPKSPEKVATEIARNSVPSSSKEILLLAARNLDLALEEPTHGPAFDGKPTAINLIASNIQELVYQSLVNPSFQPRLGDEGDLYQAFYSRLGHAATPLELEHAYQDLLEQLNSFRETFYTENLYQTRKTADGDR